MVFGRFDHLRKVEVHEMDLHLLWVYPEPIDQGWILGEFREVWLEFSG